MTAILQDRVDATSDLDFDFDFDFDSFDSLSDLDIQMCSECTTRTPSGSLKRLQRFGTYH